jgi:hypothetical protein
MVWIRDPSTRKNLYRIRIQGSNKHRILIRNTVWKAALYPIFSVSVHYIFLSILDEEVV